jgi:trimethylamine corrinoid protein
MSSDVLIKDAIAAIKNSDLDGGLALVDKAVDEGIDPMQLLEHGFSVGIRELGDAFGRGELFLPELIMAADVMKKVSEYISEKSNLSSADMEKGIAVIATVEGDLHDIGKGIVVALMRAQGITVIDLGRDVSVDEIIEAAEANNANIIGTSALLTTTLENQKLLEQKLREKGIRDKYKTMVGGAPATTRWASRIGADAYGEDAGEAVNKALELLQK